MKRILKFASSALVILPLTLTLMPIPSCVPACSADDLAMDCGWTQVNAVAVCCATSSVVVTAALEAPQLREHAVEPGQAAICFNTRASGHEPFPFCGQSHGVRHHGCAQADLCTFRI